MTKTKKDYGGIAQRLIAARSGHGWSQADLSEVSGVAAAQISRYEQGRSKPRSEVVAKIAKALAVDFEWLAFGEGDAEAGLEVPIYPASQKLYETLELTDEIYDLLEEIARARGWTIEMAVKQTLLEGSKALRAEHELEKKSAKPK